MPSPNGGNGLTRTGDGRFAPGNAGGPGNPYGQRVAELRAALLDAVTPDDLTAIIRRLVEAAKAGDVAAAKLVLDRLFGREPILAILTAAVPADDVRVVFDDEWYGNDAHKRVDEFQAIVASMSDAQLRELAARGAPANP